MGITVWWQLETDSQDKIEAMARKWMEKYKGELDLAHVENTFKEISRTCRFCLNKMRVPLEAYGIKTYEDLENQHSEGKIKLLTKTPSMQEFINMVHPMRGKFLVFNIPFGRELQEFLRARANLGAWSPTWVYPGIHFGPPVSSGLVEGEDYIYVPCTGFMVNTAASESISLIFAELSPNKYFCTDMSKTQPFRHEDVRDSAFVHMLMCDFLADVEKQGYAKVVVKDEGDYYNTRSLDVLLKNFGAGYAVIAAVGKALEEAGWKRE